MGLRPRAPLDLLRCIIVDIETGEQIAKISVPAGSTGAPNGLATPAAVDLNGDVNVDYVYAGDLLGNLWKFDLTSTTPSNWKVAYTNAGVAQPLYVARDSANHRQPITSRPEVGRGPNGNGMQILFGTGKFLEDPTDRQLAAGFDQSFYGIYDPNTDANDRFTGSDEPASADDHLGRDRDRRRQGLQPAQDL